MEMKLSSVSIRWADGHQLDETERDAFLAGEVDEIEDFMVRSCLQSGHVSLTSGFRVDGAIDPASTSASWPFRSVRDIFLRRASRGRC